MYAFCKFLKNSENRLHRHIGFILCFRYFTDYISGYLRKVIGILCGILMILFGVVKILGYFPRTCTVWRSSMI